MALYMWYEVKPIDDKEAEAVYDLYFGYVVRFACYGVTGMGLLWMQSTYVLRREKIGNKGCRGTGGGEGRANRAQRFMDISYRAKRVLISPSPPPPFF